MALKCGIQTQQCNCSSRLGAQTPRVKSRSFFTHIYIGEPYVYTNEMQRNIEFAEGEYYHIYNRGVDKRNIFTEKKDYERFLRLLFVSNGTKPFVFRDIQRKPLSAIVRENQLVAIGAYCLMPNHFHILIKEISENGASQFMEKLATGYSMYFNKKYQRSGTLFQGPFKAEHVDYDEYLKYLFAYIHLNPVKLIDQHWKENGIRNSKKAKQYLDGYHSSSYLDYIKNEREEQLILTKEEFPEYFTQPHEFKDFVNDWLEFDPEKFT